MDISVWIVLWVIILIVQNVFDKKKPKHPPQNSEIPPDFEIPTLSNDPNFPGEENSVWTRNTIQSAEVREFAGRRKNFSEVETQNKFSETAEQKNLPLNLNSETAMNAIIFSEILGKPKSKRRR